jgi:NADPH:quinone reductase-like Zn-dependent oxidoreductase
VKHQYVGQQVCALVPGGGYAEYVAVDAGSCLPKPSGISLEDAAALPETLFTVWHNIFQRGKLKPGEDVFIYGGSGGIGSMAIQLVNLYGSRLIQYKFY